jgi:hypothetical protein
MKKSTLLIVNGGYVGNDKSPKEEPEDVLFPTGFGLKDSPQDNKGELPEEEEEEEALTIPSIY